MSRGRIVSLRASLYTFGTFVSLTTSAYTDLYRSAYLFNLTIERDLKIIIVLAFFLFLVLSNKLIITNWSLSYMSLNLIPMSDIMQQPFTHENYPRIFSSVLRLNEYQSTYPLTLTAKFHKNQSKKISISGYPTDSI